MTDLTALIERARAVDIGEIIAHRGYKLRGRGVNFAGPCPVCGGTDRFSIEIRKQVFNCRACRGRGFGSVSLVMFLDGCEFLEAVETITGEPTSDVPRKPQPERQQSVEERVKRYEKLQAERESEDRIIRERMMRFANELWLKRDVISEDCPVGLYLRRRGFVSKFPETLGYLQAGDQHPAAMIAAFGISQEIDCGVVGPPTQVQSVHLTRLTPDGRKVDEKNSKRILGSSVGLPIVLAPANDLLAIAVTEGIEDGLSALQRLGMGVWVAGAAGRMPPIADAMPSYVECVTVFAHNDETGMANAKELARLLTEKKIETRLLAL
jgi:putative DNA primase/helicase